MERSPIVSSNLRSIGYDKGDRVLEVEFKNGIVEQYYDVPPHVHDALMAAPSKGAHFHAHIRNAYRVARV